MAISIVQTLEQALKTIYLDPLVRTIDEQSGPVLAAIEKNSDNVVGNEIKFALQYGRNGGIGARAEDDNLPAAAPRQYKQATTGTKNLYGTISFSEKLMLISKNSKASFVDAVSTMMDDITNDARDMMRRNIMQKSDGIMATVTSTVSSNKTVTVTGNIKMFYVGQKIDIFTVAGTTVTKAVDGLPIVDVDYDNGTIKFASNVSVSQGSYIGLAGNYNNELTGLGDIMTVNNTIYGIDRSTNKWYNPRVYNKATTADGSTTLADFDSAFLQEAIDDLYDFSGAEPNFICCNSKMKRAYIAEQNDIKRNIETMKVDGGYKLISYNGIPISNEKYCADGEIYLINTADFVLSQVADWGWMDADGSILTRVANKAAYEAALTKYCDLICKKPFAQAKITGIDV